MKKRSFVIVAFLVVSALTLGIGFASLTAEFILNGAATYNSTSADDAFDQNFEFTGVEQKSHGSAYAAGSNEDTCAIDSSDPRMGRFSVKTLATTEDEAVFVYTIKNNNNVAAVLSVPEQNADDTANPTPFGSFNVAYEFSSTEIAASGTVTLTVTVTLKSQPATDISLENYVLNFVATMVTGA